MIATSYIACSGVTRSPIDFAISRFDGSLTSEPSRNRTMGYRRPLELEKLHHAAGHGLRVAHGRQGMRRRANGRVESTRDRREKGARMRPRLEVASFIAVLVLLLAGCAARTPLPSAARD